MGAPGGHRRRQAVLAPAAERLAGQRHDAGRGQPGSAIEFLGEFLEDRAAVPQVVEERQALVEMPGPLVGDVGHLGVEVVVVVALPRRQAAIVGGPDSLQRHRRRATSRGGAMEILDEIIFPRDRNVLGRNRHR